MEINILKIIIMSIGTAIGAYLGFKAAIKSVERKMRKSEGDE
jgi:uncharacterized membrane protein YfcA